MTEIQFLLDLILTEKLSKSAKEKCLSRIGEVEQNLSRQPPRPPIIQAQAPSTQMLIERQTAPIQGPIIAAPGKMDRETGTVMVNNGDGTYGKRKF